MSAPKQYPLLTPETAPLFWFGKIFVLSIVGMFFIGLGIANTHPIFFNSELVILIGAGLSSMLWLLVWHVIFLKFFPIAYNAYLNTAKNPNNNFFRKQVTNFWVLLIWSWYLYAGIIYYGIKIFNESDRAAQPYFISGLVISKSRVHAYKSGINEYRVVIGTDTNTISAQNRYLEDYISLGDAVTLSMRKGRFADFAVAIKDNNYGYTHKL